MPIITKPASIQKGTAAEFSLSKSELVTLLTSISASAYYLDPDNWKSVSLVYKSAEGNQKKVVQFDATQAEPSADFFASLKAQDIFQIEEIIIRDFDSGSIEIKRSQLVTAGLVADFDVDMTPSLSGLTWVSDIPSNDYVGDSASIEKLNQSLVWQVMSSTQTLSGDISVEARIPSIGKNMMIGFTNTYPNSSSTETVFNSINLALFIGSNNSLTLYWKKTNGATDAAQAILPQNGMDGISVNNTIKLTLRTSNQTLEIDRNGSFIAGIALSSLTDIVPMSGAYSVAFAGYEPNAKFDNIVFLNEEIATTVFTRDFSSPNSSQSFENADNSSYGLVYDSGYLTFPSPGGNMMRFNYPVAFNTFLKTRIYFDSSSVQAGMGMRLQHVGVDYNYYDTTLSAQQVSDGFIEINAFYGLKGTSHLSNFSVNSYVNPSTDIFKIYKIELSIITA